MGCLISTCRDREVDLDRRVPLVKSVETTQRRTASLLPPASSQPNLSQTLPTTIQTQLSSAERLQRTISEPPLRPPTPMEWESTPMTTIQSPNERLLQFLHEQGFQLFQINPTPPAPDESTAPIRSIPPVPGFELPTVPALPGPSLSLPPPPPPPPQPVKHLSCSVCTTTLGSGNPPQYPCKLCKELWCVDCIREVFLAATKDESRMPPKCCIMIQLGVAKPFLSCDEIGSYQAKFEEWSTQNRLYCPEPRCSTFISPRLIHEAKEAATRKEHPNEKQTMVPEDTLEAAASLKEKLSAEDNESPEDTTTAPTTLPAGPDDTSANKLGTPVASDSTSTNSPVYVRCPSCLLLVCTECKQEFHRTSPCKKDADIDPDLAKLLEKWKIKRCPKCRAAVRRMFGCPHIRCRCGGQWCWACLLPIDECRAFGCTEQFAVDEEEDDDNDDDDDEDDESEIELQNVSGVPEDFLPSDFSDEAEPQEDLTPEEVEQAQQRRERRGRFRRQRQEREEDLDLRYDANMDFGDEPNADDLDPWNCDHRWRVHLDAKSEAPKLECHRCWRDVELDVKAIMNGNGPLDTDKQHATLASTARTGESAANFAIRGGEHVEMEGDAAKNDEQATEEERPVLGVECTRCGVVYCHKCEEQVSMESRVSMEARVLV